MRRAWLIVLAVGVPVPAGAAGPRERSWFEQVERDRDRGAGGSVEDATGETQRLQERRDLGLGVLEPRRRFERFDEERDRELQIEAAAQAAERGRNRGLGVDASDQSVILSQPKPGGLPTPAAVVARQQRDLDDAKETLERSLRAVDDAEERELRLQRRRISREGKADQFEQLRAGHRQAYDSVRSRIFGRRK